MTLINGIHFNNLKGDFTGGLSAAVVALPLAIAFGVLSGAGPLAGVVAAVLVGFFAALFGSTASQISGPTGPMTVLITAIFMQYTTLDPVHGLAIGFTVVMLSGLFLILFGVFRLGQYINMIPHPVVSGLMSGLGLTIIVLQIGPLLGHANLGTPWESFLQLPNVLSHPATNTAAIGVLALILMYFQPKSIGKFIPAPLTTLLIGTAVYLLLFPNSMIKTVGDLSTSLPVAQWPLLTTELIIDVIKSALALAILASIDTLITSLVADNISRDRHDSNKELVGQGIANFFSGLFGGIAGAGASMRTVINVRHGGQTALSGIFHSLIILLLFLLFGQYIELVPHAVLAAILIKVASDLIDWDYIKRLHKAPKPSLVIMFSVLFLTLSVDIITAIFVGIAMTSLLFMKRMSDQHHNSTSSPEDEPPLSAQEKQYLQQANGRILLFHISGPMSFGAAKSMVKRVSSVDNYEALVLDLSDVYMIDFSSSLAIEDIILDAQEAGHHIFISGVKETVKDVLTQQGVMNLLLSDHQYKSRSDALHHASQLLEEDK